MFDFQGIAGQFDRNDFLVTVDSIAIIQFVQFSSQVTNTHQMTMLWIKMVLFHISFIYGM